LKKKKKGCGGKDFAEKEGFKSGMKETVGGCAKKIPVLLEALYIR